MPKVKGSALASRIRWLQLNHGEAGVHRLRQAATAELCEVLETGAVMSNWYPFEQFVELNERIDRVFGQGDLALVKSLGRHGADANLTTIYRLFFKVTTIKWVMARAARLWGMHYDSGRLIIKQARGKEVELRIEEFSTPHRVHCLAVQGWAERSVELSGGSDVVLEEQSCRAIGDSSCRFRITWG